ncbi:MAG: alpha/beta fold hydrolase [Pseudonocardiaceae bacterium]
MFRRIADSVFRLPASGEVRAQVVCFPPAGSWFTAFSSWKELFPGDIELWAVTLPGHGIRLREPAVSDLRIMARMVTDDLMGLPRRRYAIFGHSMGGLLGFQTVRELLRRGFPPPEVIGVSAVRAPHRRGTSKNWQDDRVVLDRLRRRDALPEHVLATPNLLNALLPAFQADFTATDTYRATANPPLDVPLLAWAGGKDPDTRPNDVEFWRDCVTSRFHLTVLDAGHSYIAEHASTIVRPLVTALDVEPALTHRPAITHKRGSTRER